jgi:hypothetical protein
MTAMGGNDSKVRPAILLIEYKTREALIESVVPNIQPAGFFVPTPFAAETGTTFILRIRLEAEGMRPSFR